MKQANNVIRIPTSIDTTFFRYWIEFLRPFHQLTDRETDVAAEFLKQRYKLSKVISDNDILDRVVMSDETKKKVREECKISLPHFQVIMGKLRKCNIILDEKLNPRFIPNITEDKGAFNLLFFFDLQ